MEHVRLSKNMSDNWVQDSLIFQKGKNDQKKKKTKPRVMSSEHVIFQPGKQYEMSANQNNLLR